MLEVIALLILGLLGLFLAARGLLHEAERMCQPPPIGECYYDEEEE